MPLPTTSVYHDPAPDLYKFASRRSVVHSTEGIVSCTQPLAAQCGLEILRKGGNAADAAVAVASALNLTEPCSTGIGGDMFLLYWDAATKSVKALNGSGRASAHSSLEAIRQELGIPDGQPGFMPKTSIHSVTVPGAAAGWVDTVEKFGSGKLSLAEILDPAIRLGERGFPIHEETSHFWQASESLLRRASPNGAEMLKEDPNAEGGVRAPRPGEIKKNPTLAKTFRTLAAEGKAGFYTGRIAEEIVRVTKSLGGVLDLDDLKYHLEAGSEPVEPISIKFEGQGLGRESGLEVWEHPPNGQGIVALMALGIIQELEKQGKIPRFEPSDFNSAEYLHVIIESLRIAFADGNWFVTDPNVTKVPTQGLISSEYLAERAKLFDPSKASDPLDHGKPPFLSPALNSSDTVYFSVTDSQGNAASFIVSNYGGFGTGIIPRGAVSLFRTGVSTSPSTQTTRTNLSLVNVLTIRSSPAWQPTSSMVAPFQLWVMGGFMQPQGHVQVLLGQLVGKLNPQQALDAPRICVGAGFPDGGKVDWTVSVEDGMPQATVEGLASLGHKVQVLKDYRRAAFGRGQIVRWTVDPVDGTGVWSAGSDPRSDGAAYPLIG